MEHKGKAEKHVCPDLSRFTKNSFGNYELMGIEYGNNGFYAELNVDGLNDIFLQQWRLKNRMIDMKEKSIRIRYCPFCGQELYDPYPNRKLNKITFNKKGEAVLIRYDD